MLRLPLVLSSHSDTQKYLPGTWLSKPLYLPPPSSTNNTAGTSRNTWGDALRCSRPSWTLSSCCTGEWLNRPPTSKWLEFLQMERRVEWGQDGNAIQSRSQTLSCQYYKCNWKPLKVLLMLVDIWKNNWATDSLLNVHVWSDGTSLASRYSSVQLIKLLCKQVTKTQLENLMTKSLPHLRIQTRSYHLNIVHDFPNSIPFFKKNIMILIHNGRAAELIAAKGPHYLKSFHRFSAINQVLHINS